MPRPASPDRYEELLVNPTLLTLAGQRGDIDYGGLRCLVLGLRELLAARDPNRSQESCRSVELDADPIAAARRVSRSSKVTRITRKDGRAARSPRGGWALNRRQRVGPIGSASAVAR